MLLLALIKIKGHSGNELVSSMRQVLMLKLVVIIVSISTKWLSLNTPKPAGNSKRKETCSQASSNSVGDPEVRPEGIKAAKAKKKNSAPLRSLSECQTVWEMKKEDLLMRKEDLLIKERLTKLAILDTLLAKKDPLTEPEEATKNKLLALI
ncbi:PREDICTED: uncharacterized protein LOC106323267 [Brassica oleracea var. oleracea]|uniref:uncharacterized protein LOC106323267 n=1 Tax=Brassica oleracea var. oleracea TaxID=109376 RepID=UPI0006A6DE69|nr:PREDICTED: uncharacterized protein LOC106323267 [Brassica oleracea var. oleracea]